MQHLKIVFLSVLLLCPGFSFSEFDQGDKGNLMSIATDVSDIEYILHDVNDKLGNDTSTIFQLFRQLSYVVDLCNTHLFEIADDTDVMRYNLVSIAHDIDVMRNTQLSSIMANVDASEGHLRFMRSDFATKLENLNLIASALSGQNSSDSYVNLGFDSIGKNVEKIKVSTESISNDVSDISYNLSNVIYEGDDGLNYLRVSPTPSPAIGEFLVLTNFVLGSSFLSPWTIENGLDYYQLYSQYKSGDIDSATFIAEMGLYNWLAGLNFGDWYVTSPDDADLEDMDRWGIVENAKIEWSALAESTAFSPHSSSDARFWLYGTRYLTDYVGDIWELFTTNAVSQISDSFPSVTDEIEMPSTYMPEDIVPEEPNEQQTPINTIIEDVQENKDDPFLYFETLLGTLEEQFTTVDSSSGNLQLHVPLQFLGVDQTVSITIEQQEKAQIAISRAIHFVSSGFKIASAVFVACALAKTLTSRRFNVVMMYE